MRFERLVWQEKWNPNFKKFCIRKFLCKASIAFALKILEKFTPGHPGDVKTQNSTGIIKIYSAKIVYGPMHM